MKCIIRTFILLASCTFSLCLNAQSVRTPNDPWTNHIIDRFHIQNPHISFQTNAKFYQRKDLSKLVLYQNKQASHMIVPSKADKYNARWLLKDNWDYLDSGSLKRPKKFLKYFYAYDNAWFSVNQADFKLVVNPIIAFGGGIDATSGEQLYRNTRGGEMRGMIGQKVGFYSMVTENQIRFPNYLRNQIDATGAVPGAGFHKKFGLMDSDFLNARGYISFNPIEQINVQFGHDRNFIGNGYRSLIISDFAKEHLFLKLQTSVWKIDYTNLFSEQVDFEFVSGSGDGQKKKYEALHYLSIDLVPGKFTLGLFERVVFSRQDSNQAPGFEANYLNPVIFYRSVEHGLNSSDNALLGLDWKWNLLKTAQFYGQFVLDEFSKNDIIKNPGHWGNKWAFQAGLKYINIAGISNLDLQLETNMVRPFTYTHYKRSQNVIHFNQPLAHPLGTNFKEYIGIVRYQPLPKLNLTLKAIIAQQGLDSSVRADITFGGDVLTENVKLNSKTDVHFFDGLNRKLNVFQLDASYQIFHRMFFDVRYIHRSENQENPLPSWQNQMLTFGFRMNIASRQYDY